MIRITLDKGRDIEVNASLADLAESLSAAFKSGDTIPIILPTGRLELDPHRIIGLSLS